MQAALDLADSGFYVYMAEKKPAIGGVMAQLDKTFPTNDCSMCIMAPKLVECGRHLNIEVITNSEVAGVQGVAGDFTVRLVNRPRYVDEEKVHRVRGMRIALPGGGLPGTSLIQGLEAGRRFTLSIPRLCLLPT